MSITILTELRKWMQGIFIFVYETVIGNLIYSEEKIRQTLRKLPLLCSLRWRPVVDSKDIDGYICVLFEEVMLFLKRLWGWWSKKSTLKELNFGALDVSEYTVNPDFDSTQRDWVHIIYTLYIIHYIHIHFFLSFLIVIEFLSPISSLLKQTEFVLLKRVISLH